MPGEMSSDVPPPVRPRTGAPPVGRAAAVLVGWYAVVLVGFALWIAMLPTENTDGSCEGIGFGCTPAPRDGALLLAIFYGLPLLAGSFLVSLIALGIGAAARFRSAAVAGTLAAFVGLVLAASVMVALAG
ncbi:hypothetical protein [Micromonospora sp. NPDC049891]|uniref:hypothetical protein n=1 Tax=Micromonospora sp. NPDC049891 TaxID=3155655 RepID=UPI0033D8FE5F